MSDQSTKVPSQVFRWFEKMKTNYENSVQATLKHFENFTNKQQERIDQSNKSHIEDLKKAHQQQLSQQQNTIDNLRADIDYYKQQLAQQQHTIKQLSGKYDATINLLLSDPHSCRDIKDIIAQQPIPIQNYKDNKTVQDDTNNNQLNQENTISDEIDIGLNPEPINEEILDSPTKEQIYQEAIDLRQSGEHVIAFQLFQQAAEMGCINSLGAIARAYFLSEGIEEDQVKGLSYLIEAANSGLEQAISKSDYYKANFPELYHEAELYLANNQALA